MLICISRVAVDVKYLYVLFSHLSSLENSLFNVMPQFIAELFVFLMFSFFFNSVYILDTNPLLHVELVKNFFFSFCRLYLHSSNGVLCCTKAF